MSYEGYTQHICQNGHQFNTACNYGGYGEEEKCPDCESESAWSNEVDDTNGDSVGIILHFDPVLISSGKQETCNLGHSHTVIQPTYRVPAEGELVRCYWDGVAGEYRPLNEYGQ